MVGGYTSWFSACKRTALWARSQVFMEQSRTFEYYTYPILFLKPILHRLLIQDGCYLSRKFRRSCSSLHTEFDAFSPCPYTLPHLHVDIVAHTPHAYAVGVKHRSECESRRRRVDISVKWWVVVQPESKWVEFSRVVQGPRQGLLL